VRALLRDRNLVLFAGSGIVSLLGDWALLLALPFFAYGQTHSVLSTGGIVAAQLLPRLVVSPLAGVLVDRWDRRLTLVGTNLFRAGLMLLVLVPAAGGPLWIVYAVALLEASAAQLFVPAEGALLPAIVAPERLLAANSILSTATAVVRLVGPPLGGLLYATAGLGTATVVDSVSFLFAGLVVLAIRVPAGDGAHGGEAEAGAGPAFVRELADGVRYVAANRVFQVLSLTLGAVMVAQGVLETLLVPFVRDVLQFDALRYGVVTGAQGLGALAGALVVGAVSRRLTSGRVVGAALVLAGVFLVGFTMARALALSAAFLLLLSAPVAVAAVWIQTFYQQQVSAHLLGRILGLTETVSAVGILVGVGAATLLTGRLGTIALLLAAAGWLFAVGVAAIVALWNERTRVSALAPGAAGVAASVD
jgi:predicted MFS family arabinose efflux permease